MTVTQSFPQKSFLKYATILSKTRCPSSLSTLLPNERQSR